MNSSEIKMIIDRYNNRFKQYGNSSASLGWQSGHQDIRFSILLSHWDLNQQKIMDFGCGFGDMYGFLRNHKIDANYIGYDINTSLINMGQNKYPEAQLICRDFLSNPKNDKFDYIFSSGVHNIPLEDNNAFMEKTFKIFDSSSRKGFALNFISDRVDYKDKDLNYTNPIDVLELAYTYSRKITLRNDYMPFEFTIFVDKCTTLLSGKNVYLN